MEKTKQSKADAKKTPFFAKKLKKGVVVKSAVRAGPTETRSKQEGPNKS